MTQYKIICLRDNDKQKDIICSSDCLLENIKKLIEDDFNVMMLAITSKELINKEIKKVYNSYYAKFYRKYKINKISKESFDKIKLKLKEFKDNCDSDIDFKAKAKLYENTLRTIIK